ncbi:VapE domain-containing protein [Streptococcus thoraltensis]
MNQLQAEHEEVREKVVSIEYQRLSRTDSGKVKKTRTNLITLLKGGDEAFRDVFAYNEAINDIEIVKSVNLNNGYHLTKGVADDTAIVNLWGYIADRWGLEFNNSDIYNACLIVAQGNRYNPIKDFLNDVVKTAENRDPFQIIRRYLNIEDTEYNKIVFDLVFRGAIARVMNPGIQFDYCLDLVGRQGTGKTTFFREVFKGFQANVTGFSDKDDLLKMMRLWTVNDDELIASNKLSFGELKSFITATEHLIRRPYGRITESFLVDYIITRTTNDTGHLKDATGDRRFLAVQVEPKTPEHGHNISDDDLRDIWGNYYRAYKDNQVLFYSEDSREGKMIAKERAKFKAQDDIIERLEWYLETLIPEDFYKPTTSSVNRHNYYWNLEETGEAHRDGENKLPWIGTVQRDRIFLKGVINDIFQDEKSDRNLKNKIKIYMNNLEGWEYRKNVRFGTKITSGWVFVRND